MNVETKPIADQLREAIRRSFATQAECGRVAGVAQATVSRFLSGKTDLSLRAVNRIADHLGLKLCK